MRILIIGCGYSGLALGARLVQSGHEVFGMRRDSTAAGDLEAQGIRFLQGDVTEPESLKRTAPHWDVVINLVSSTRGGVDEYKAVYLEGTRTILSWLRERPPAKYLHTSSTSVYGQNDGSVVTESSNAEPVSATSRILIETETEVRAAFRHSGFPAIILRVAGIYGPQRGHLFKQYLKDEAVLRDDGEAFINNIHVQDLARAIINLIEQGIAGETYNLVDDEPVTQLDFFRWLSGNLGKPMPPSAPGDPLRKRGLTNKRVSNAKLRATDFTLLYPTFREGYATELKAMGL